MCVPVWAITFEWVYYLMVKVITKSNFICFSVSAREVGLRMKRIVIYLFIYFTLFESALTSSIRAMTFKVLQNDYSNLTETEFKKYQT